LRLFPLKLKGDRLREMLNFGLAAFFGAVTVQIVGQTDLMLAEWTVNIEAVAIYSIGTMLVWNSTAFVSMISAALFPEIQRAVGAGRKSDAVWLMFRQARLILIMAVLMNVGFAVFSDDFLKLWMGSRLSEEGLKSASLVMSIVAVNRLQISMTGSYPNMFNSLGKIWKITYANIAESFLNIGISLFLAMGLGWGLVGIALGSLISRGVTVSLAAPLLLRSEAGINLNAQFREIFLPGLIVSGVFAIVCFFIKMRLSLHSWPTFLFAVGLAATIYIFIAGVFLVPKDMQIKIIMKIRKYFKKETS